ncbi:hypothetical protein CRENBAI_025520 [Crenichthys baileyi]|uniref:Membrane-anchored junction protein n=1 Tax=Crenichthys baileyi TaxID=28760 RepID=A0AAV9RPJ7_9TELE
MALHPFSFPVPETRYFKAGSLIYKFKIRRGNSFSEGEVLAQDSFDQEMEEIVRTVLGNLDCLQPFSTPHFTVFPYRRSWGKVNKHRGKKLLFYPFVIILYLEKNICQGKQREKAIQLVPAASDEPRSKRSHRDSPLEEAIIKEIMKYTEAECSISVTGTAELEHQPTVKEAVDDSAPTDEPQTTQSTPEKPGILKQLVRNIFPFIFRPPEA